MKKKGRYEKVWGGNRERRKMMRKLKKCGLR
jgi:hypothetical protein